MNLFDQIEKVDIGIQISTQMSSKGVETEVVDNARENETPKENVSKKSNIPKKRPSSKKSAKQPIKKLKFETESD